MSVPWIWVEELVESGPVTSTAEETQHLAARRVRVGDAVVVFDGSGHRADAQIESLGRSSTILDVGEIVEEPPPRAALTIASAIPKGDRLSTMLQMLTQLGVAAWQPLLLDDSVVRKLDPKASRLLRILTESCKVARRARRMQVLAPCALEDALARCPADAVASFGDREGERLGGSEAGRTPSPEMLFIGPEAGFSEAERRVLERAGAMPRSFAPHNLRIETAAIAGAAAYHQAFADEGDLDDDG